MPKSLDRDAAMQSRDLGLTKTAGMPSFNFSLNVEYMMTAMHGIVQRQQ